MIYSGMGPIAFVAFLIIYLFGNEISPYFGMSESSLFSLLIFAIAGAGVWFLGRLLNKNPIVAEELDESGRKFVYYPKHTIFFIRMEYWGPILFVISSLLLLRYV